MSKERPILFSGPMVRAILEGRKTQTRRVVKPQPDRQIVKTADAITWRYPDREGIGPTSPDFRCPFGQPGDRLWVRETHYVFSAGYQDGTGRNIVYRATQPYAPCGWTPSIYMPRWASRITLEVTGVRVERLQDIGVMDCRAEGVEAVPHGYKPEFKLLWNSLNAERAPWESNPWVWVIEFRRTDSDE